MGGQGLRWLCWRRGGGFSNHWKLAEAILEHSLTSVLQVFVQCCTRVSPVFHQCLTIVLSLFHKCFTSVLPVFYQCFTTSSSVFHQCFTNVSPVFYQWFTSLSTVFYQCLTSISPLSMLINKLGLSCEVYQTQYLVFNYLLNKSTLVFKALKFEVKQLR